MTALRVTIAASTVCMLLTVCIPTSAFAQVITPPSSSTTVIQNNITVSAPPPDDAEIASASVTSSQAILNTVIAPPPIQWTNELLGLPDIWRTTPPELTYNNGAIRDLSTLIRGVAMALIALAALARGIGITLGREEPMSLARLFFAGIVSWANLIFWEIGIQLNNAITASIGAPDLPSLIRPHLTTHIDPASAVGTVILLLVYAIVALLLLFSLLFRLGLIDILITAGSLFLLCYATTQTEHIANHYTRMSTAVLFGQILVVLCLRVASVLAGLGTGGTLGTLLAIVVLLLARSAPQALLAGSGNGGNNGNRWGRVATRLVLRRVGR